MRKFEGLSAITATESRTWHRIVPKQLHSRTRKMATFSQTSVKDAKNNVAG
jgi:hypothetical protein